MRLRGITVFAALLLATAAALGQEAQLGDNSVPAAAVLGLTAGDRPTPALPDVPITRARMSPELALQTYNNNAEYQLTSLGSSSDTTVVEANLTGTGQKGRFELSRHFLAPKSLAYGAIKFVGDTFVKTNVITKLLQSEVDHVEKGEGSSVAITEQNYKFNYKGSEQVNGAPVYIYQVKPRKKRPGLFKGKILLDAYSGRILRAEGSLVKSPSVFVKKIEFTQDYEEVGRFSLPVHTHSIAVTRLVGTAVVDIFHSDYAAAPAAGDAGAAASNSSAN